MMIPNPKNWMTLDEFFGTRRSEWDNRETANSYLSAVDKNGFQTSGKEEWISQWFSKNLEFGHYQPKARVEMEKTYAIWLELELSIANLRQESDPTYWDDIPGH